MNAQQALFPRKEGAMQRVSLIKLENGSNDSYINLAAVVAINFQPKREDAQARLEFVMVDHITRTVFGEQAEKFHAQIELMLDAQ